MAGSVRTALSQSRSALCRVGTCQLASRRSYPLCRLETNMTQNDLPKDLSSGLAGVVAKTFNKLETVRRIIIELLSVSVSKHAVYYVTNSGHWLID